MNAHECRAEIFVVITSGPRVNAAVSSRLATWYVRNWQHFPLIVFNPLRRLFNWPSKRGHGHWTLDFGHRCSKENIK